MKKILFFSEITLLLLMFMVLPFVLQCQNLEDFRIASTAKGVDCIPFPDLHRDATSIANDVNRRKDEVKEFKYENFEKQKDNLLLETKKKKEEIESIKKDIEDFKNKHNDVSVSSFEADIKKKEEEIEVVNDKIKGMNDEMAKAEDSFDRLNHARAGLRESFDKVLDELSKARSNPDKYLGSSASDDDKRSLEGYIKDIEQHINDNIKDHKDQEEGAKKRKRDFEALIAKTSV